MHKIVKEGKAIIRVEDTAKVSKEMEVFYNPVMRHNRDITILILSCLDKDAMQIASPMAGSGVREIRLLLELPRKKIREISINDYSAMAVKSIRSNLKLNKIKLGKKIIVSKDDANLFFIKSTGFDYIDIDPFGSPNPFLDSAAKRIARDGVMAVTATDTAALTGTYPEVCRRKYWAAPLKNELMHETGLRILIRKAQLVAAQYDKALIPIFSYFKEHYFRVFFRCVKGKKETDSVIGKHCSFQGCGPIWNGKLWDSQLAEKMYKKAAENDDVYDNSLVSFLRTIKDESAIDQTGYYDVHKIVKRGKISSIPRKGILIKNLQGKGYLASETHFSGTGIRTNATEETFKRILRLS